VKWAVFWLLMCFAATAWAPPYLEVSPEGYERLVNPDPTPYYCEAILYDGTVKTHIMKPYEKTIWRRDIVQWWCEPL
jgi:hypothetical protein